MVYSREFFNFRPEIVFMALIVDFAIENLDAILEGVTPAFKS